MNISLPTPGFKVVRRQAKATVPIRIVPEPKTFVLPVTWEETVKQPIAVPVCVNSQPHGLSSPVESVIRLTIPLELRLEATL